MPDREASGACSNVWTLTLGVDVASAHLRVSADADRRHVLYEARRLLLHRYRVGHTTLQLEADDQEPCPELHW